MMMVVSFVLILHYVMNSFFMPVIPQYYDRMSTAYTQPTQPNFSPPQLTPEQSNSTGRILPLSHFISPALPKGVSNSLTASTMEKVSTLKERMQ
jgi:hypothetical protein